MRGVIFDIDGTLVQSYELDSKLFVQAVRECLGSRAIVREDWSHYMHVTDTGILTEIFEDNGYFPDQESLRRVKKRFLNLVREVLHYEPCKPTAGAPELLRELKNNPDVTVGIATGAWRQSAYAKLRSAGLDVSGIPLVSADDHHDRAMILSMCGDALRIPDNEFTYVGDGPWDKETTQKLGWDFIGIGPRVRSSENRWISDFTKPNWTPVWESYDLIPAQ